MESISIPTFRAKEVGSDKYIEGYYQQYIEGFEDNIYHEINNKLINPNTLSIHFPNMVDKRGNKIFCSLNASGKGGDICESEYYTRTAIYRDGMFYLKDGHILAEELFQEILVVGVQR